MDEDRGLSELGPWLSPKCAVGSVGDKGLGIVVQEPIEEDEIVIVWGGEYGDRAFAEGQESMQWDDDLYSVAGDDHPAFCINHSCDPNLGMSGPFALVALRSIEAGEEVTADYAMWEADETYVSDWVCRCGSPACRGRVTGRDWRLRELQARYRGRFSPLLEKRIAALSNRRPGG